jgi:hypothetical protein
VQRIQEILHSRTDPSTFLVEGPDLHVAEGVTDELEAARASAGQTSA